MKRRLRLLYAAGPGDVLGTYGHWVEGRDDPRELSTTYSGQFYDLCRDLDAVGWIVSYHEPGILRRDGRFTIEHRPIPLRRRRGLLYHLGQASYALGLLASALRMRAAAVILETDTHRFLLSPLAALGVRLIPSLNNTLWPRGRRPTSLPARVLRRLSAWFFRHAAAAIVCLSPECARQVLAIARTTRGPILEFTPQYDGKLAPSPPPPLSPGPFRLLFAGSIEREKGIFDLLDVARRLTRERGGGVHVEIAGSGSAETEVREALRRGGLEGVVTLLGQLDRDGMARAYARSHAVIVPTTSAFAEGLNRVCIEAVLAGRPVVATDVCPAVEVLGDAVLAVPPDAPRALAEAVLRLADDRDLDAARVAACAVVRDRFLDRERGFGATLRRALAAPGAMRRGDRVDPSLPEKLVGHGR